MRKFMPLLAALVALLMAAGCGASGNPESGESGLPTVKVSTYGANLPDVALLVAQQEGFFKEHGVNVQTISFQAVPAATAALKAGDLDLVGSTGLNQAVANHSTSSESQKLVDVVAYFPTGVWQLFAGKDWKISGTDLKTRLRSLKGAKIGVPALGSEGHLVAAALLRWAGLDPDKDVSFIATGLGPEAVASFKTGQIDAVVHAPPYTQPLLDLGATLVYDMTSDTQVSFLNPWLIGTYLATAKGAQESKDKLAKFQAGLSEAIDYIHNPANTAHVAEIWAKDNQAVPLDVLKKTIEANRDNFSPNIECSALTNVQKFAVNAGLIEKSSQQTCDQMVWSGAAQFKKN